MRARRRRLRRLTSTLVIVVGLAVLGTVYAALTSGGPTAQAADADAITKGRQLYLVGCASCHGLAAQGGQRAPSLIGVGAAAVDFQVGTGRMPLEGHGPQAPRKQPAYDEGDILNLAAYIASLSPGPAIPSDVDTRYQTGSFSNGGELFRTNCSQCHNIVGSGGALTYGRYAPSLSLASPKQIYEAMITGPENMPVFSDQTISPKDKLDIIKFVRGIKTEANPGGAGLGRVGPVTEGLVVWVVGIGLCVVATVWIGSRL